MGEVPDGGADTPSISRCCFSIECTGYVTDVARYSMPPSEWAGRCRSDAAHATLQCIAQAGAAEMRRTPFGATFRMDVPAPQRCGACHSACMDLAGRRSRDAAHGFLVFV